MCLRFSALAQNIGITANSQNILYEIYFLINVAWANLGSQLARSSLLSSILLVEGTDVVVHEVIHLKKSLTLVYNSFGFFNFSSCSSFFFLKYLHRLGLWRVLSPEERNFTSVTSQCSQSSFMYPIVCIRNEVLGSFLTFQNEEFPISGVYHLLGRYFLSTKICRNGILQKYFSLG